MRVEQEKIHPVELDTVDAGLGRQIKHGVQIDTRLGAGTALAHEARPHGVVQFGVLIAHAMSFQCGGRRLPRCFKLFLDFPRSTVSSPTPGATQYVCREVWDVARSSLPKTSPEGKPLLFACRGM